LNNILSGMASTQEHNLFKEKKDPNPQKRLYMMKIKERN
jgi:hypothetical protein